MTAYRDAAGPGLSVYHRMQRGRWLPEYRIMAKGISFGLFFCRPGMIFDRCFIKKFTIIKAKYVKMDSDSDGCG